MLLKSNGPVPVPIMPHARLSDVGTNLAIAGLFCVVIKAMLSTSGLETELAFYGGAPRAA